MRVRAAPAASRGGHDSCVRSFVPTRQRPPCVKGPQGSAACGRTSDRSGPAATCLGGPQRGPGRLSGNPELSAARLTGGIVNPSGRPQACHLPLHRGGLGRYVRRWHSRSLVQRADVGIGPYRGTTICAFDGSALTTQPSGRLVAAPTAGMGGPAGRRGRCPHRPAPATGGSHGRRCAEIAAKRAAHSRPYGGDGWPGRA